MAGSGAGQQKSSKSFSRLAAFTERTGGRLVFIRQIVKGNFFLIFHVCVNITLSMLEMIVASKMGQIR